MDPVKLHLAPEKKNFEGFIKENRRFSSTVLHLRRRQYLSNIYKNEGLSRTAGFHEISGL
jgi:DNA-binding GntR family transcriptional regulator